VYDLPNQINVEPIPLYHFTVEALRSRDLRWRLKERKKMETREE
jgi:hypothetical protein